MLAKELTKVSPLPEPSHVSLVITKKHRKLDDEALCAAIIVCDFRPVGLSRRSRAILKQTYGPMLDLQFVVL